MGTPHLVSNRILLTAFTLCPASAVSARHANVDEQREARPLDAKNIAKCFRALEVEPRTNHRARSTSIAVK